MRGSSGSEITVGNTIVGKSGGNAVAQGTYLKLSGPCLHLPRVYSIQTDGYLMEKLEEIDPHTYELERVMPALSQVHRLYTHVYPFDSAAFADKFRWVGDEVLEKLMSYADTIPWKYLKHGFTHGDPTRENTMRRSRTEDIVFIDPIPPSAAIPNLLSVDYGKILQSVYGWESWLYDEPNEFSDDADQIVKEFMDDDEWQAANFWQVVHLFRAVPYMKGDRKDELFQYAQGWLADF